MDRGIAIVIIGMLWGYVLIEPMRRTMGAAFAVGPLSPAWPLVITVTSSVVSLAVLIALNGIVSTDRKMGYYRFLFSKPVSVVAYYAQLFFVYMAGVLVSMLLLAAVLAHGRSRFQRSTIFFSTPRSSTSRWAGSDSSFRWPRASIGSHSPRCGSARGCCEICRDQAGLAKQGGGAVAAGSQAERRRVTMITNGTAAHERRSLASRLRCALSCAWTAASASRIVG